MLDLLAVQSSTTNATIITLAYTLCLAFILSSAIGWTYEKTFLGLSYSRNFVQGIVDAVPAWFTNGLNFAAKLLTAYGLSLLLSMMASKGMMVFFLLGFFACAYLGLDVTGVSIFGVLLAVILMGLKYSGNTAAAAAGIDDDYDPLEDDEL